MSCSTSCGAKALGFGIYLDLHRSDIGECIDIQVVKRKNSGRYNCYGGNGYYQPFAIEKGNEIVGHILDLLLCGFALFH
jgi:hypothetical protein